jgi:hypothetical protein
MKDFRGLNVWQRAHRITPSVYRCTRNFLHKLNTKYQMLNAKRYLQ